MVKGLLDKATLNIPCPQCGKEFKKTIAHLRLQKHVRCPSCRHTIPVDHTDIARRLQKLEKPLAKELASLKRAFERHK